MLMVSGANRSSPIKQSFISSKKINDFIQSEF